MENTLGSLDGVVDAKANFVKGIATVRYDPGRVTPAQMVEAINTNTFYRARLPHPEKTTVADKGLNLLPFIAGGALILLAGGGVYRIVRRRQVNQAVRGQTSAAVPLEERSQ